MGKLTVNDFIVINNQKYRLVLAGKGVESHSLATQQEVKKIVQELFRELSTWAELQENFSKDPSSLCLSLSENKPVEVYQNFQKVNLSFKGNTAKKVQELYQALQTQDTVLQKTGFFIPSSPVVINIKKIAEKAFSLTKKNLRDRQRVLPLVDKVSEFLAKSPISSELFEKRIQSPSPQIYRKEELEASQEKEPSESSAIDSISISSLSESFLTSSDNTGAE